MTSSNTLPIAVAGATGRMGNMLIEAILAADDCRLSGALDIASSPALGQDASAFLGKASGVSVQSDVKAGLKDSGFLIDFTRPEGTMAHLQVCRELGVKAVIGTTGFTEEQKAEIAEIAKDIAIVMAPNMSVGVNVTLKLLQMAAQALATGYDIEIIEAHHRHKVDAPSGTALKMGEVIADAIGRDLKECAVYERYGHTGERDPSTIGFSTIRGGDIVGDHTVLFAGTGERDPYSIGFATIRGGDIVGDHTVLFAGIGERIEVTHKSSSRSTYAQGSLRAVRYLAGQQRGLFDMFDVLNLR